MRDQIDKGQEWIISQFVELSNSSRVDEFSWTSMNLSGYDGAVLITNQGDHIFFSREKIEDSANGVETQKLIRQWIKDRLRSGTISTRKEFTSCVIKY
jgi:hypothetical protein